MVSASNKTTEEVKRRILLANRCYFGLASQLRSRNISRQTKCKLYKTLIRLVLTYGAETWTLTQNSKKLLGSFESKVLRKIFGATTDQGFWRRRYNHELYQLYNDLNIVGTIKINRLKWVGHVIRMDSREPAHITMFQKLTGQRRRGRPKLCFIDDVEDLRSVGVRRWKRKALDKWNRMDIGTNGKTSSSRSRL